MGTTHESSAPYQTALDWSVPSMYAGQLRADLTELQAYRAAQPVPDPVPVPDQAKKAAMKLRALHAGTTKTNDLHAVRDAMIELHRPQLAVWNAPGTATARAKWLAKQINTRKGKFNEDGTPSVSGWRTVYNHLKTLSL